MNEIFKRRSVRKFNNNPIEEEQITQLLRAAMRAPSAGNEQPSEFVVIREREIMMNFINFHPYAKMLETAPCTIVICGNKKVQKFSYDFWIQDCSAATQNLLLEAVTLGLGGVWLGVYPIEERTKGLQELLKLPEEIIPLAAVALGHPAEQPKEIDTYIPERVHYEKW